MTTKTYTITNKTSGLTLGAYIAATPADALDALARDAGYASHEAACAAVESDGDDLVVTETVTAETIRVLVEKASAGWAGLSWETGPQSVEKHLGRAAALRAALTDDDGPEAREQINRALRAARGAVEEGGAWWPDNGSHEAQTLRRDWRDLGRDLEELDARSDVDAIQTAHTHAEWLATAEREHVEGRAAAAQCHGADALAAAEAGDWDTAVEEARAACGIEMEFGDAPTWRPVREAVEAAAEAAQEDVSALDGLTPGEAWDRYVGAESRTGYTDADLAAYVAGSPLCEDLDEAERAELLALLRRA